MKTTTTINLTVADLEKIIANHFDATSLLRPAISFKVSDISDDRFGGSGHYQLVGCDVTLQIDMEKLLKIVR